MSVPPAVIERARAGDRAAISEVLASLRIRFERALARNGGDPHAHQDVIQEALLVVWQRLSELREAPALWAWARRILLNEWRSHARREARWRRLEEGAELPVPDTLSEEVFARENGRRLMSLMPHLPASQREPFELGVLAGLGSDGAAERLGISPESCRKRIRRAASKLKGWLERERPGGPAALP